MRGNPFTSNTYPPLLLCWITNHKGVIRNIFCQNCTCTDESIFVYGMPTHNRTIGSQGDTFLDEGWSDLIHLGDFSPWIINVCKYDGRAAEDTVFHGDTFIDAHVVLDLAAGTDGYVGTDDDILADITIFADLGAGEDVGEVPDLGAFADGDVVIDDGGGVDIVIRAEG